MQRHVCALPHLCVMPIYAQGLIAPSSLYQLAGHASPAITVILDELLVQPPLGRVNMGWPCLGRGSRRLDAQAQGVGLHGTALSCKLPRHVANVQEQLCSQLATADGSHTTHPQRHMCDLLTVCADERTLNLGCTPPTRASFSVVDSINSPHLTRW